MITIVIVLGVVAAGLTVALSLAATQAEVATSSSSALGSLLTTSSMPPRPRGVQEEDLPRFAFKGEASAAA